MSCKNRQVAIYGPPALGLTALPRLGLFEVGWSKMRRIEGRDTPPGARATMGGEAGVTPEG